MSARMPELPDKGVPVPVEVPVELVPLVQRAIDDLRRTQDSRFKTTAKVQKWLQVIGTPEGLPTLHADFARPDLSPAEQHVNMRTWLRRHEQTIGLALRPGSIPFHPRKADGGFNPLAVTIPIEANLVTNRQAQRLLRDVLFPSTTRAMIEQDGATAKSKYRKMALNAIGVGTDNGAAAVGNTQLGAGTSPLNQFCWYHLNKGGSLGATLNEDPVLSTTYAVDAYHKDTTATITGTYIAAATALWTLTHADDSPSAGSYEATIAATWDFGTNGDESRGNFGSDASPDAWREIALANEPHTSTILPGSAHPDVHHLGTHKVFPGTGFAKNSAVKLTNEYTERFSSG